MAFLIVSGTVIALGAGLMFLRIRTDALLDRVLDAARVDGLTELPNLSGITERLEQELDRSARSGHRLAVIALRLSGMREINSKHGVVAGDELIRRTAEQICSTVRPSDMVARIAGARFLVVAPETDGDVAAALAEQAATAVRRAGAEIPGMPTLSAGVACYPVDAVDAGELIRCGVAALELALEAGREQPVVFSAETHAALSDLATKIGSSRAETATLLSFVDALDARRPGALAHGRRVGELSYRVALELGLPESRAARVRLAGVLHEVGTIGVRDEFFDTARALTDQELDQVRKAPEIGARMLGSRAFSDVRTWVAAVHERPDGGGYPRGLRGEEIPLEARIVAAANIYETVLARDGSDHASVLTELRRAVPVQLDGGVVEALSGVVLNELREQGIPLRPDLDTAPGSK